MPGPVHGGIVRVDRFAPGAGVVGEEDRFDLSDFGSDVLITSIILDAGTGATTSLVSLFMSLARSADKFYVFRDIPSSSHLFIPGDPIREFGILLPAGATAKMTVRHAGTDNLVWLVQYAAPSLTVSEARLALSKAPGETREIPPIIRAG